jgi:hypothetical protein
MFTLYTVAPLLYRMASSAYFNISLLTSDFYGLLFGMYLTTPMIRVLKHLHSGLFLFVRALNRTICCHLTKYSFAAYSTTRHSGYTSPHFQWSYWVLSYTSGMLRVSLPSSIHIITFLTCLKQPKNKVNWTRRDRRTCVDYGATAMHCLLMFLV